MPGIPEERGIDAGRGNVPPIRPGFVGDGHGICEPTSYLSGIWASFLHGCSQRIDENFDRIDLSRAGPDEFRGPNRDKIFRGDVDEFRRDDPNEFGRNGLDEFRRANTDNLNIPSTGELNRPVTNSSPGSISFPREQPNSSETGSGTPQDRRTVLIRTATKLWMDKADDDLHPIILLEEETLVAWMMRSMILPSSPVFLVYTHP